jgi:plastocyanin
MKKLVATGAAAAVAAGSLAVPAVWAATKTVQVKDNKFAPTSITVRKGTTVKWVWKGVAPHNVTVTKGPVKFKSSTKTKGTFSKKLTRKGTYSILCTIHAPGMKMTVKVR